MQHPSLAINPLGVLNSATVKNYTVTGTCDSSIQPQQMTLITLEDNQVSGTSVCQSNNTFSIGLDAVVLQDLLSDRSTLTLTFRVIHGDESFDSSPLANNIIPLTIDQAQSLAPLSLTNASAYAITGKCDPSLGTDNVEVEMGTGGNAVTEITACNENNTFSATLDVSGITEKPDTSIKVTHDDQVTTTAVQNNIVRLSFNTLPRLNLSTATSYTVEGQCDSSLTIPLVSVSIKNVSSIITQRSTCQNNSFSVSFNLSPLTPTPSISLDSVVFQASYGSESVESFEVPNEMIPLSIDTNSLSPLSLSNANAYTLTGKCDSSLGGSGTATIGTPNASDTWTCDVAQKTFSVFLDAKGITSRPDATITLTYGGDTQRAIVANNILRLQVDTTVSLTTSNEGAYPVRGTCNPSISGQVKVTLTESGATAFSDCDGSNNTFLASINVAGVMSNPASMTVTHGSQRVNIQVTNEVVPLRIDTDSLQPINLANAATYSVTGDCDSSTADLVNFSISDEDSGTTVTETSPCTNKRFSVEFNLSAMRSDLVTILASHGTYQVNTSVANEIVPLSFNTLASLNLSTATSYTVEGRCDSSLTNPLVSLSIKNVSSIATESPTCQNNSFSTSFDLSPLIPEPGVSPDSVVFQASYGSKSVESSEVPNGMIPLRINPSALGAFNLQSSSSYTVMGECDSSITAQEFVTVDILEDQSVTETTTCTSNAFSVNLVASSISVSSLTFRVQYGEQTVTSTPITNHIVPLSFNTLPNLDLSNAASYAVGGQCDPSLGGSGIATIGTPNVSDTWTCDLAQKTFSVSLDASGITSWPAIITVTYGDTQTTTVANNIPQLEVNPPTPLTTSNQRDYPVSGQCNPNISGQVLVILTETGATTLTDCDGSNNIFSTSINAEGVVDTVSMTVTHGSQRVDIQVTNKIVPLHIDTNSLQPINLSNAATYSVTGDCDSSITNLVSISLSGENNDTTVTETSSCASDSFSVELDVSAMRSDLVTISASHETYQVSTSVANEIVPLSFNELVEEFYSPTASSYNLSGKCDSSLGGSVELSISGTDDITKSTTCNNNNTFEDVFDGSSHTEQTITFQATYGDETVSSNSIVNGLLLVRYQSIAPGQTHTCALTTDGNVKCWGYGGDGLLGNGSTDNRTTPVDVLTSSTDENPLSDIETISVGTYHTCALTTDGHAKCWGRAYYQALGDGTNINRTTPVDVHTSSTDENPLSDIEAISVGTYHTCALTTDGHAKCWGNGSYGKLGNGATHTKSTPVNVRTSPTDPNPLSDIETISNGSHHTCALMTNGQIKCWGYGGDGQLGNGSTDNRTTPVDVLTSSGPLSDITAISAGNRHTCALTINGNVKCWGPSGWGQLGNGSGFGNSLTPVNVHTSSTNSDSLSDIAAISAGGNHTCALRVNGNVKCWGQGVSGQLGNRTNINRRKTPVNVRTSSTNSNPLSGIAAISAGNSHTCALTVNEKVKCWGQAYNGELGNGSDDDDSSTTPVDIVDVFLP